MIHPVGVAIINPKYIVFQNAEGDEHGAVWWIGYATHVVIWKHLHKQDSNKFNRPMSAGMAEFNTKTKTFRAHDASVTLNLVPHESDSAVLTELLTDNSKSVAVITCMGQSPEFTVIMGHSKFINAEMFDFGKIFAAGKAQFRVHDSNKPFKLVFGDVRGESVFPEYLEYLEDRLFGSWKPAQVEA